MILTEQCVCVCTHPYTRMFILDIQSYWLCGRHRTVWHCRHAPCLRESYRDPHQGSCPQTKMLSQQHLHRELALYLQRIGLCPDTLWFFEEHTHSFCNYIQEKSHLYVWFLLCVHTVKVLQSKTQQKMSLRCLEKERLSWQNFLRKITGRRKP